MKITKKNITIAMVLGMLGCLCYGGGDWLMIYGDTAHVGVPYWLTTGAAGIAPWRNSLAMFLAFPGIICYGTALFFMENFIKEEKQKKLYHYLNAFGLTPWMCLHLFYIMILYLFAWMNQNGYAEAALQVCSALYNHLAWIVMLSEAFMLPVFVYWFILQVRGKTYFPKWMAAANVLVIYGILYAGLCIPYWIYKWINERKHAYFLPDYFDCRKEKQCIYRGKQEKSNLKTILQRNDIGKAKIYKLKNLILFVYDT